MKKLIMSLAVVVVVLSAAGAAFAVAPPAQVPEIDPAMATGALTVLIGGTLILLGRREKK